MNQSNLFASFQAKIRIKPLHLVTSGDDRRLSLSIIAGCYIINQRLRLTRVRLISTDHSQTSIADLTSAPRPHSALLRRTPYPGCCYAPPTGLAQCARRSPVPLLMLTGRFSRASPSDRQERLMTGFSNRSCGRLVLLPRLVRCSSDFFPLLCLSCAFKLSSCVTLALHSPCISSFVSARLICILH